MIATFTSFIAAATAVALLLRHVHNTARTREEGSRQKLLLRAVINSAPDPVAYRAPDGTYLGVNQAYARMVGKEADHLVGRRISEIFEPAVAARYSARDALVLGGAEHCEDEYSFTDADGLRQVIEMVRSPLRDANGRNFGVLATGRNITQRKMAEEEAQRARQAAEETARAKSGFLASVSHEIRTPMTAVLGLVDLLADGELSPAQRRHVEAIRTSGRHLLHIINDILDFSRIEARKLALETVDFSLPELLEEIRSLLHPNALERGLAFGIEADAGVPRHLRGDPTRLRQILLNLASNAIKFTPKGSVHVHVGAQLAPGARTLVAIEVRDTGIGIPAEKLRALFSPFTQADQSIARVYGGSGLGLAISKRLAEAMGGRLDVQSTPGAGSVFRLQLPFDPAQAPDAVAAEPIFAGNEQARRILVAEDVEINREILQVALTRQGHHVEFAVNGVDAIEKVNAGDFDLVLMDIQMPVLDGVEATRRIRQLPSPKCELPILGLTASVLAAEQHAYYEAGMNECLSKPFDWRQLGETIARYGRGAGAPRLRSDDCLDAQRLQSLRAMMGNADVIRLLDDGLAAARTLCETAESHDSLDQLRRTAHRVKGSTGTLGMTAVYRSAAEIEEAAVDGRMATSAMSRLRDEIAATRSALHASGFRV